MSWPEEPIYTEEELARIEAWSPPEEPVTDSSVARLRRTTSGAVLAGMMVRLGELLEGRPVREDAPVVREADGDPDDPEPDVLLEFDPDSPAATRAILHRRAAGGSGGG